MAQLLEAHELPNHTYIRVAEIDVGTKAALALELRRLAGMRNGRQGPDAWPVPPKGGAQIE